MFNDFFVETKLRQSKGYEASFYNYWYRVLNLVLGGTTGVRGTQYAIPGK